ncbi:MAG: hypothetical protein GY853_10445 [PVC group bacterium]|nr:hypothetical protein [PVC group bacterium]
MFEPKLDKLIKDIADAISNEILPKRHKRSLNIFLVGESTLKNNTIRDQIKANLFAKRIMKFWIDIYYPEYLFNELLGQSKKNNLLELETYLAKWVHSVAIILRGEGAIAELGAFANHKKLNNKLIVIVNEKYRGKESFIIQGPVRYLHHNTKSIIRYHNLDQPDIKSLSKDIYDSTIILAEDSEVDETILNPIEAQHFVSLCIYLMEPVDKQTLIWLFRAIKTTSDKDVQTIISTSLSILHHQEYLILQSRKYSLTSEGLDKLKLNLKKDYKDRSIVHSLDNIRLKILNGYLRK